MVSDDEVEEKSFKFEELSDEAKERARQEFLEFEAPFHDFDSVISDAVQAAACLGIDISDNDIRWSGFHCQGDGASFSGSYKYRPDYAETLQGYAPTDRTLAELGKRLAVLQVPIVLTYGAPAEAKICIRQSHYSHSGCMDAEPRFDGDDEAELFSQADYAHLEEQFTSIFRDFADWIYKQLDMENDYLQSDERVDEALEGGDTRYTESGAII